MDKILAKVGALTVTENEVNDFLAELGARGQGYNTPEGRKAILNQLIGNKLLLLDAKRNLFEAEPQFKAQLAKLKDNLLSNYAAEKAIAGVNVTDKDAERDYIIVLGAAVHGDTPSLALQHRLEGALEYLEKYPDSPSIPRI